MYLPIQSYILKTDSKYIPTLLVRQDRLASPALRVRCQGGVLSESGFVMVRLNRRWWVLTVRIRV